MNEFDPYTTFWKILHSRQKFDLKIQKDPFNPRART